MWLVCSWLWGVGWGRGGGGEGRGVVRKEGSTVPTVRTMDKGIVNYTFDPNFSSFASFIMYLSGEGIRGGLVGLP